MVPDAQFYVPPTTPGVTAFDLGDESVLAPDGAGGETVDILDGHTTYVFTYVDGTAPAEAAARVTLDRFEQLVRQGYNSR